MVVRSNLPVRYRRSSNQQLANIAILSVAIVSAALLLRPAGSQSEISASTSPVVASFDTVTVPVPVEPAAPGTRIRDVDFRRITYPAHQVPDGALIDISRFLDFVAVAPLAAGMPLFAANMRPSGSITNPVIEKIPEGMRAMTIRVDATSAVEGWAGSGAIVDVLLVKEDRTTVVAERVTILSAERSVAQHSTQDEPRIPSTTTLLVTQQQCLAINTAVNLGKIAFALRSVGDAGKWRQTQYEAVHLSSHQKREPTKGNVNGYITFQEAEGRSRSYALADGKWITSDVKPQGFFVSKETRNEKTPPATS